MHGFTQQQWIQISWSAFQQRWKWAYYFGTSCAAAIYVLYVHIPSVRIREGVTTGHACKRYQLYQVWKPFSRSPTRPGITQNAFAGPSCPSLGSFSYKVGSKGASLRGDSSTPMQQLRVLRKSSALHGCLPKLRVARVDIRSCTKFSSHTKYQNWMP